MAGRAKEGGVAGLFPSGMAELLDHSFRLGVIPEQPTGGCVCEVMA